MQVSVGKIVSLIVALAIAVLIIVDEGGMTDVAVKGGLALLLPLALIWFPEQLGSFTGYVGGGRRINTESPPILVSILGWFLLIGIPLVVYVVS